MNRSLFNYDLPSGFPVSAFIKQLMYKKSSPKKAREKDIVG